MDLGHSRTANPWTTTKHWQNEAGYGLALYLSERVIASAADSACRGTFNFQFRAKRQVRESFFDARDRGTE